MGINQGKTDNNRFAGILFQRRQKALVIAEIELENKNQQFELPDFIGEEVTDDARYYNACLFKNPYKMWNEE